MKFVHTTTPLFIIVVIYYTSRSIDCFVLNKCICNINEVYVNNTCKSHSTYLDICDLDSETKQITTEFSDVVLSDVKCHSNQTKARLEASQFLLLDNSTLYHWESGLNYHYYCIEHTLLGSDLSWYANVCLDFIIEEPIYFCCNNISALNPITGICDSSNVKNSLPTVYYGEESSLYTDNVQTDVRNIQSCPAGTDLTTNSLDDPESSSLTVKNKDIVLFTSNKFDKLNQREFCIAQAYMKTEIRHYVRFCLSREPYQSPPVRKCCKEAYVSNGICVQPELNYTFLNFYDAETLKPIKNVNYTITYGFPKCNSLFSLFPNEYLLLNTGHLNVEKRIIDYKTYCLDNEIDENGNVKPFAVYCSKNVANTENEESSNFILEVVKCICMAVSCIFFFLSFITYAGIETLRNKLCNKCFLCHILSLFISYMCVIIIRFNYIITDDRFCQVLGYTAYFFTLSSFFWLNIMCFDMWKSFKIIKQKPRHTHDTNKRFLHYCFYGFGGPLMLAVLAFTCDYLYNNIMMWSIIPPRIIRRCFISKGSIYLYLYVPMCIVVITNFVFLVAIMMRLRENAQSMKKHSSSRSSINTNRYDTGSIYLYFKLFIIMGITWISEIVVTESQNDYLVLLVDIINALRGVLLFYIYVWKKSVYDQIKKAWGLKHSLQIQADGKKVKVYRSDTRLSTLQHITTIYNNDGCNMKEYVNTETEVTRF